MAETTRTAFNKSDFLNAIQLVEKLNRPVEEIHKVMLREYKKHSEIKIKNIYKPMVVRDKTQHLALSDPRSLQLHPLALQQFVEILEKGK